MLRTGIGLLAVLVLAEFSAAGGGEVRGESTVAPFLGEPRFHAERIFTGGRFPNVGVALDGTVIATWGNERYEVRRSTDGGESWHAAVTLAEPGFHGGGLTVDETTGGVFAFVEAGHPPAPLAVYRSDDHGESWREHEVTIEADAEGNRPSMHMNEGGITLRRGEHAGRLIRPARWYADGNRRDQWPRHYTNAVYSDDGGRSWRTSEAFPEKGTGEAAIVELSDGRLYYNSRVHWPEAEEPTRRRSAVSRDGGHTWEDWRIVDALPDGNQGTAYGCMAGLVRLPVEGRDILIYSNLDEPGETRRRLTVWASFDGGETWPIKRLVHAGPAAYSSLAAGRPGSPSEGWVYLQYEAGESETYEGGCLARFNLAWVLEGERTGDGELSRWIDH